MFNGFSYAIPCFLPHRTHVTHYMKVFSQKFALSGEKKKFLCFIKTLKGIYTSIFVFLGDREVIRFFKLLEELQTWKYFQEWCHLFPKHYVMIFFMLLVKNPGKFMWKRKQLLCISFAFFTAFTKIALLCFSSSYLVTRTNNSQVTVE